MFTSRLFRNREHAGQVLAEKLAPRLQSKHQRENACVLSIPRGGLPVAEQVCKRFNIPLDVIVCKKIGFPGHSEFAIGAVSPTGRVYLNEKVMDSYGRQIPQSYIDEQKEILMRSTREKERQYRDQLPVLDIHGKDAYIVDDGIATGLTMRAAIEDAKHRGARSVIVAVPVLPPDTLNDLRNNPHVDDVIYVEAPSGFRAVGQFYQDFGQTQDFEAKQILQDFISRRIQQHQKHEEERLRMAQEEGEEEVVAPS